ncbi:MAG TPA: hypothetical protein ENK91_15810, partial [Bacteroidetes bacterium]|nr:hypothetical protein [Bacteroidota bacterium]
MKSIFQITALFILINTAVSTHLIAQEQNNHCGTIEKTDEEMEKLPWYGKNEYLYNLKDSIELILQKDLPFESRNRESCNEIENQIAVPIRFFIYRENATDPGVPNDLELQDMMDALNGFYQNNGMRIRFYMKCPVLITDPDKLDMGVAWNQWEGYWANEAVKDPFAINIHVSITVNGENGAIYSPVGDFIVVPRDVYNSTFRHSTLAHEIGHYFGLEHTHRNSDKGRCRQEPVSRTRMYAGFWCNNQPIPRCALKGDALCDTPADPNLNGKVDTSCSYSLSETDFWGDSYVPDEQNIMSYSRRSCRDFFSPGQISVMYHNIFFKLRRNFILNSDVAHVDPDKYEPDDSDSLGVPRLLSVGETQCHSFHSSIGCLDPVDWLRVDNSNGIVGSYIIEIEELINAPVETINVYNTDSNGFRDSEISVTETQNGSIRSFEIRCDAIVNDLLVEVVRKSPIDGVYKISLHTKTAFLSSNINNCNGLGTLSIEELPSGSSVNWTSSNGVTLSNSTGVNVSVTNVENDLLAFWVEALIISNGCQQIIRKSFIITPSSGESYEIVEMIEACYPPSHPFGRYGTVPATNVFWDVNHGNVFPMQGTYTHFEPDQEGWVTLTATAAGGCNGPVEVSKNFYVERCKTKYPKRISVSPNPSNDVINIQLENYD